MLSFSLLFSRRNVRPLRILLTCSTLLAALAVSSPLSAFDEQLVFDPETPNENDTITITLQGTWGSSCFPELVETELVGDRLDLWFEPIGGACLAAISDYSRSVEVGPFPAGKLRVEAIFDSPHQGPILLAAATIQVAEVHYLSEVVDAIGFVPASPTDRERFAVVASGNWSDGCVPQLERVSVVDDRIRLFAIANGEGCTAAITPFLLGALVGPLNEENVHVEVMVADRRFGDQEAPFVLIDEAFLQLRRDTSSSLVLDGRFRLQVTWTDGETRSGRGRPIRAALPEGPDTGSAVFSFFQDANAELLIKVLDGCTINDHLWVFFSAATALGYEILVEDLESGESKTYSNEPGQPAAAVTDVEAFATCGQEAAWEPSSR